MAEYCNHFEFDESSDEFIMGAEPPEAFAMYPNSNPGPPGPPGEGVPAGGTAGQLLVKASGADYDTVWVDADAGIITYDEETSYEDGTVGKAVSQLNSEISEININKADVIVDSVGPAAIASFPDGADNMPIREITATIEPVQDLHGQDAPYPPGGGKNVFDYNTFQNKLITAEGVIVDSTTRLLSDIFTVQANNAYIITYPSSGFVFVGHAEYNDSDVYQRRVLVDQSSGSTQITPATNRIRLYFSKHPNTEPISKDDLNTAQVTKGTTPPDKFYPYSNICPISGHTGVTVYDTGVNVWDEEYKLGYYNSSGVYESANNQLCTKNPIPVKPSTSYYLSIPVQYGNSMNLCEYDKDGTFINRTFPFSSSVRTFTTSANTYYVQISFHSEYGATYGNDISVNFPSTDHDFHQFQGNTYSISWQTEAGTVYVGTLTINEDGSGGLTAKRASQTITLSSSNVARVNTNTTGKYRFQITVSISDAQLPTTTSVNCGALFDKGPEIPADKTYARTADGIAVRNATTLLYYSEFTSEMSRDDFLSYIGQSLQIVYPLATPLTYTLDSIDQLFTKLGTNNIWVDTGSTTVKYPCDTKLYIDKKIAGLT